MDRPQQAQSIWLLAAVLGPPAAPPEGQTPLAPLGARPPPHRAPRPLAYGDSPRPPAGRAAWRVAGAGQSSGAASSTPGKGFG